MKILRIINNYLIYTGYIIAQIIHHLIYILFILAPIFYLTFLLLEFIAGKNIFNINILKKLLLCILLAYIGNGFLIKEKYIEKNELVKEDKEKADKFINIAFFTFSIGAVAYVILGYIIDLLNN